MTKDRKEWHKHKFRTYALACTWANRLNGLSVIGGGHVRYIYVVNPTHLTIVRYYLNTSDQWKDNGLVEAPEEFRE